MIIDAKDKFEEARQKRLDKIAEGVFDDQISMKDAAFDIVMMQLAALSGGISEENERLLDNRGDEDES